MTVRILILTAFVLTLLSCTSNSSRQTSLVKGEKTVEYLDTLSGNRTDRKEQYANIVHIFYKDDTAFLDADYIQYLTGDEAIEAGKNAHEADTFKTEDGKTHIDIPNDYFIVNESKRTRQLPLAKDCVFELIINPHRAHPIEDNSLKSLQTIYNDSPFILTLNEKGVIIKIKELFLP
jgi:hypothetical protein